MDCIGHARTRHASMWGVLYKIMKDINACVRK